MLTIVNIQGKFVKKYSLAGYTLAVGSALLLSASPVIAQKDIKLGHLTYHTGEYGAFGEFFDGVTDFSLEVINETPPLGQKLNAIHQDVGTIGESRAVRNLTDKKKVDILLNVAHGYDSYRKNLLKRIKFFKSPLLPSVHGGAIDAEIGGTAKEPLFRGSPMDSAQSAAAILYAKESGKQSVVLVSTQSPGHQLQMEAAKKSAEKLGLEVLHVASIQPDWTDYSSVVDVVADKNADAVIMFTAPGNGGLFVKNAADAGHSWFIVGTSEWQEPDFVSTATMDAIAKHDRVALSAYSHADNPAWGYYKERVESSEQADIIGDAANSYAMQYYDLLVTTALAIEKAGDVNTESWSKAMYEVTAGDGVPVYSYEDGIAALRAGKEINYDGVTGSMEYTSSGVVAGLFGIFEWVDNDTLVRVSQADGDVVAELDQL